jgi:ribosomal protein L9
MTSMQNSAPVLGVNATNLDSIAEHVARLKQAREAIKFAQELEKEAKAMISEKMKESGATYGLLKDEPIVKLVTFERETSPSVEWMRINLPEVQAEHGKKSTVTTLKFM